MSTFHLRVDHAEPQSAAMRTKNEVVHAKTRASTTFGLTEVKIKRDRKFHQESTVCHRDSTSQSEAVDFLDPSSAASQMRGFACLKENESQDRLSKMVEVWVSDLTAQSMEFAKSLRLHLPEHREGVLLGKMRDVLISRAAKDARARELLHVPAHIIEAKKKSDVEDKMLLARMVCDCVMRSLLAMVDTSPEAYPNASEGPETVINAKNAPVIEFNPNLGKQDIVIDGVVSRSVPACVIGVLRKVLAGSPDRMIPVPHRSEDKVKEYLQDIIDGGWLSCPCKTRVKSCFNYSYRQEFHDNLTVTDTIT